MAQVEKTVLVPYSAAQMFVLVDTVELYPDFLPWCGGAELIWRNDISTSATLHINYHGIKQSFTTENTKEYPSRMNIALVNGPFHSLQGHWQFIPLSQTACKIEFRLNYEFASSLLDVMIAPVFNHIANTFVDAFVGHAEKVFNA